MAIPFVPYAGDVLMCDFAGFVAPEMTKIRRVVILSPRARLDLGLYYMSNPFNRECARGPQR
jgi:uncharacterized protein YifN (PemK superfamily)